MNLSNFFGISQRATGKVDKNGKVTVKKVYSYDLVADPSFAGAYLDNVNSMYDRIQRELDRKKLLEQRREKINRLNNINE